MLGEARVYGGGLHNLEPKELASVPKGALIELLPESWLSKQMRQLNLFKRAALCWTMEEMQMTCHEVRRDIGSA